MRQSRTRPNFFMPRKLKLPRPALKGQINLAWVAGDFFGQGPEKTHRRPRKRRGAVKVQGATCPPKSGYEDEGGSDPAKPAEGSLSSPKKVFQPPLFALPLPYNKTKMPEYRLKTHTNLTSSRTQFEKNWLRLLGITAGPPRTGMSTELREM